MNKHGSKIALFALCMSVSFSCASRVVVDVLDKTPECLTKVDWEKDAFEVVGDSRVNGTGLENGTERIYVRAKAFDELAQCAFETVSEYDREFRVPPDSKELANKYPNLQIDEYKDWRSLSDLLLGQGTEERPTIFMRAAYYLGVEFQSPIAVIVKNGISYVRSPNYPGRCDDLKADTERYEWCTGKRQPSPQDQRLKACMDQHCTHNASGIKFRK